MTSQRISRIHRGLVAALVTIYISFAILGIFWERVDGKVLWVVVLVASALCIVLGSVLRTAPPWLTVGLVAIGSILGGMVLVWTLFVPLAAALLVGLTYSLSRRRSQIA